MSYLYNNYCHRDADNVGFVLLYHINDCCATFLKKKKTNVALEFNFYHLGILKYERQSESLRGDKSNFKNPREWQAQAHKKFKLKADNQ